MLLKTYNTEFDEIIITFMAQNGRPLKIEDTVNLTLLNNKWKWHSSSLAMRRYSREPGTRKYIKGYGFLSFARKY